MFCCHGFRNLVRNAGKAGISALVQDVEGTIKFKLQTRAVSKREEDRLSAHPAPLPLNEALKTSCNIGLNFCPFCGADLHSLVTSSTRVSFRAIAEKHREFDTFLLPPTRLNK
jgi:hypothetical protein